MEYLWPLLLTIHVTLVPVQWTAGSIGQNSLSFFLVLMLTEASFTISDSIKPWWIWVYWISPLSYGQRAIAVNEFTDSRWREVYFIFNFFLMIYSVNLIFLGPVNWFLFYDRNLLMDQTQLGTMYFGHRVYQPIDTGIGWE